MLRGWRSSRVMRRWVSIGGVGMIGLGGVVEGEDEGFGWLLEEEEDS